MSESAPRVIVAGGGPAAVEALLALRELAGDRPKLELIAPDREFVVRAYDVLAPFHEGRERHYPLSPIADDLDVEVIRDSVTSVDAAARTVVLRSGRTRAYDALVIAVGARHADGLAGAIPFRGARDARRLKQLLMESRSGIHQRVAFVVPVGHTWPLPLYELALGTSAWLAKRRVSGVPLTLVTPERRPLAVFGPRVSAEVALLLGSHGVEFVSAHAIRLDSGRLLLAGGRELGADLAIAMPRLSGPRIGGLPHDREGFLPIDEFGRVPGVEHVYAAGDATDFPVKQGGLATQQADAIAASLAAEFGSSVQVERFQPVLRAVLFGAGEHRYLHAELGEQLEQTSQASSSPLWPESSKLLGRYLAPYLDGLEQRTTGLPA